MRSSVWALIVETIGTFISFLGWLFHQFIESTFTFIYEWLTINYKSTVGDTVKTKQKVLKGWHIGQLLEVKKSSLGFCRNIFNF
jgi:hypothetical protein